MTEENQKREDEANRFAGEVLIPPMDYRGFVEREDFTRQTIIAFARSIETHPGIIVGRLQREGHVDDNDPVRTLKVLHYQWSD